jgi:YfiH family protein
VVSEEVGVRIAVVTADCLPILLAGERGRVVAAVHAGWRGLAGGVISACLAALRERLGKSERVAAVIGPHIGKCCYEVGEPVLDAFEERFSETLPSALRQTRPGHARLDLGLLAREALRAEGVESDWIGFLEGDCTACDAERFHSYRRDGLETGRLVHFIAAGAPIAEGDTSNLGPYALVVPPRQIGRGFVSLHAEIGDPGRSEGFHRILSLPGD